MKTIKLFLALTVTSCLFLGIARGISHADTLDADMPSISRHNGGIVAHTVHESPVVETGKAIDKPTSAVTAVTAPKCPAGWIEESGVCLPS